jgi:hypothetical protein
MGVTSQASEILVWTWTINTSTNFVRNTVPCVKNYKHANFEIVSGKFNIEFVLMETTHRNDSLNSTIINLDLPF